MKILLGLVLAFLAWAYVMGTWQLSPPAQMLEQPRRWVEILAGGGASQAVALVLLFAALSSDSALAAWLGCAGWLGWAQRGQGFWLATDPQQTQLQLLISAALVCCLVRRPTSSQRWGWGCALPLALLAQAGTVDPHWGLALGLALALGPLALWEKAVAAALALGFGAEAGLLWPHLDWGVLVFSAALWFFSRPQGSARWLLLLQWGLWLAGEDAAYPLWAALGVAAAGPLTQLWSHPSQVAVKQAASPGGTVIRLPRRLLAGVGVGLLSVYLLKPGEEWFNRRFLLGAQKAHLSWAQALQPQSLRWWVANLGSKLDMGPEDVQLADAISGLPARASVLVLTPNARSQSKAVCELIRLLAGGRTLVGWQDQELAPGSRQALLTGRYQYCGADYVVLRGSHRAPDKIAAPVLHTSDGSALYPLAEAANSTVTVAQLNLDRLPAAGSVVNVTDVGLSFEGSGTLAQLGLTAPPWLVWTAAGPNFLPIPRSPGVYPLRAGGRFVESFTVSSEPIQRQLQLDLKVPPALPSRSLQEVEAQLSNRSDSPIDLAAYRGIRLNNGAGSSPVQALTAYLKPHSQQSLKLFLQTPEAEGDSSGQIELIGEAGEVTSLGTFHYRTWRRLPAVGF